MGRLISDYLNKDDTTKVSIITAFESYFKKVELANDDDLSVMCADDWPPLDQVNAQKHLKIPVLRCLKTMAAYTREIRESHHYLRPSVTYNEVYEVTKQLDATQIQ